MGKAKDGSNCYTRKNKAGGSYVTCEGKQKTDRKFQRELSKLHGTTRVKVSKSEFEEARAGLQQTLSNAVVAEKPGVVAASINWNRSDTVRGQSRRAAKARRLTTRPPGRIETGSLNPGSVITDFDTSQFVAEAPGVVGMTTNMKGLELATYDALFNAGSDVSKGISAAVAAYDPPIPDNRLIYILWKPEFIRRAYENQPYVDMTDPKWIAEEENKRRATQEGSVMNIFYKLNEKPLTQNQVVKYLRHSSNSIGAVNKNFTYRRDNQYYGSTDPGLDEDPRWSEDDIRVWYKHQKKLKRKVFLVVDLPGRKVNEISGVPPPSQYSAQFFHLEGTPAQLKGKIKYSDLPYLTKFHSVVLIGWKDTNSYSIINKSVGQGSHYELSDVVNTENFKQDMLGQQDIQLLDKGFR